MVVGGQQVAAADGGTFETVNPATGEVLATIPRAGIQDVERAVGAARDAFPAWRDTPTLERVAALNSLAALIEEHADVLGHIDVAENGSPIREMRKDAGVAAWLIRYLAGLALQVRGETLPSDPSRFNYSVLEPFGVIGRIIPFNHPALFAGSRLVAPLVTGNTVVMKPSEYTSISALKIAELASQVLPPGVFNVVTGFGQEAGDALVRHPLVRRLAFTGADRTGRAIQASAAAVAVKTVTLELGGKNPIIIMPDANLDDAIDGAVRGMNFTWQGQSCGSTSRLLVHSSLRQEFVARLAERLEAMVAGAPDQLSTDTGSMVNPTQYDKVLSYLEIAKSDGARVVTGGEPADVPDLPHGLFFRPTLLEDGLTIASPTRRSSARSWSRSRSTHQRGRSRSPMVSSMALPRASTLATSRWPIASPASCRLEWFGSTTARAISPGCRSAGSRTRAWGARRASTSCSPTRSQRASRCASRRYLR